jgi:hypothetical protein
MCSTRWLMRGKALPLAAEGTFTTRKGREFPGLALGVEAGKGPAGAAGDFQSPHHALVVLAVDAGVGTRVGEGQLGSTR